LSSVKGTIKHEMHKPYYDVVHILSVSCVLDSLREKGRAMKTRTQWLALRYFSGQIYFPKLH